MKNKQTKKKEKTPHEIIAEMFCVTPSRVKSILKIGDTNRWYFDRIRKDRYAIYKAYSDCVAQDKNEPEVPKEKETVIFNPDSPFPGSLPINPSEVTIQKLILKDNQAIPEVIVFQSEDGTKHNINLTQYVYDEK